jgi:hypothetical protein
MINYFNKLNNYRVYLFWIIVFSSPFINFSFFSESKLPITYFIVILFLLTSGKDLNKLFFKSLDFYFFIFLFFLTITILLNSITDFNLLSFTQLFNIFLTYCIFKVTQILRNNMKISDEIILTKWFQFCSILCFISIIIFVIGIINEPFVRTVFEFFNNSGNFSQGGVITEFSEEQSARLNSLSPEPSFWGFFSAFNLALGLCIPKKNKFLLMITFISLILTFSRTGFLMLAIYLIYRVWDYNIYFKLIIIGLVSISIIILLNYFNIGILLSVDESFRQRFGSLLISIDLFIKNPILGIGLGRFASLSQTMGLDYRDVYSLFFNFLVSGGIVTFLIFLIFCKKIYSNLEIKYRSVWIIILAGWLTVSSYNLPYIWVFIGILIKYNEKKTDFYFGG